MQSAIQQPVHTVNIQRKAPQPAFSAKAPAEPFFGAQEKPSFFSAPVQPKLTVSQPNDPHEKEADAVAEQVMRMPETAPTPTASPLPQINKKEEEEIQRQAIEAPVAKDKKEEPVVQAKQKDPIQRSPSDSATTAGQDNFEQSLAASKGGGSPLPNDTKASMENRFGTDFSQVRIHTGGAASTMSDGIQAKAFAHGNDIYFNQGQYNPHSKEGQTLLAHELTHTVQQNGASVNLKAKQPPVATENIPAQVTSLTTGVFTPVKPIADYIESGGTAGKTIKVSFGNIAQGTLKVRKKKEYYETVGEAQGLAVDLPFLRPLQEAGVQPLLAIDIKQSNIGGYLTVPAGKKQLPGNKNALFNWIKTNPILMKWQGLDKLSPKGEIINQIEGSQLRFEVNDIKVVLGGFVNGSFNIGLRNTAVTVQGNATVQVKNLSTANLEFQRDELGNLKGSFQMQTQIKRFSGVVQGKFLNGLFDIQGQVGYNSEKLKGTVNIIVTDAQQAQAMVMQQLEPQQISEGAQQRVGDAAPAAGPQPGPRVIAGWGVLDFSFNEWLTGSAKVIVDGEGYITVHGEIAPPAQVTLFDPRPYRSRNFVDLHPTFRWGIPHIADVHIGLDFLIYAEAQLGPGILKNIKVSGNYSTDPLLMNDFRLEGTFNFMAYAAIVFSFGAHAGVGILGFDIDLGGKLNAKAGIKAYLEATPVIGYREKADPVEGKKGEFFISGKAEVAARPFLGLEGLITLFVDSPWPIPNYSDEWLMWSKEYPLPGEFGMGVTFGEYVLGSGVAPDIEWGEVSFDPDKFADDLLEDNVPEKQAHNEEPKKGFADKLQGQAPPAPPPPVAPAPLPPAKPGKKGKKPKPPTKAMQEQWQKGLLELRKLKDKRDEQPVASAKLQKELNALKNKYKFTGITTAPAGNNWLVAVYMQDAPPAQFGIKGIAEPDKEKPVDGNGDEQAKAGKEEGKAAEAGQETDAAATKEKLDVQEGFTDNNGEEHHIFFQSVSANAELMVASTPRPIKQFLTEYISEHQNNPQNAEKVADARQALNYIRQQIVPLQRQFHAAATDAQKKALENQMLSRFHELSNMVRLLLGKGRLNAALDKYHLEGFSGTYATMPKPVGDNFTADHQPQAAILEAAAAMPIFREPGINNLRNRAAGRAANGFAINLHIIRHKAGRTYGTKGGQTKTAFLQSVAAAIAGINDSQTKRDKIVELIKNEMKKDVIQMRIIARRDGAEYWGDLMELAQTQNLTDTQLEQLKSKVRNQILAGEDQMMAQDIDSLKH